jgi:geranylgeranyl pyrophosphate synthase
MINIEKLQLEKGHLIDELLNEVLDGDIPNLHEAMRYHMGTGGKRLRPLLAITSYEALGGRDDKILPFAAACEVLHNWLLVHDDIEDGDRVRRSQPTVWVKYGLAHGVNTGDYMAHKVFELILKTADYGVKDDAIFRLLKAMNETALRTAEGQAMDINLRSSTNPSEQEYLSSVIGKTAHYLTVPIVGAAILAKNNELIPKIIEFGACLGPAFQIADDILDLTEGKGRGEIGRDIKEGKRSLLAVHCLNNCNSTEKKKLLMILGKPPEKTTKNEVLYIRDLFLKCGSISYAKAKAGEYAAKAKAVADEMPPKLRDVLYFFTDYAVHRKK